MRNHLITAVLCCLLPFLSACASRGTPAPEVVSELKHPDEAFAEYDVNAYQLQEKVLDKTILFYDSARGSWVAYYDGKGKQYLWFPFRKRISIGYWKARTAKSVLLTVNTSIGPRSREVGSSKICTLYGKGVFSPLSGRSGGNWECASGPRWLWLVEEKTSGDVFNLKTANVPFRLNKRKTTLKELRAQCKTCKFAAEQISSY